MKRIISVLLCAVLLVSLVPSAFAADSELASLVKFAKGVLPVTDEYTEFENSKGESFGETVYSLMWSVPDSNKRIYCEILSGGEIVSYEISADGQSSDFVSAPFTREEYLTLAENFMKKVNPKYSKELDFDGEVTVNSYSHLVRVSFNREISDIPVYGNQVNLSLDKTTGEIIRMYMNFDISDKIESTEGIISDEEAKEKLFELFAPSVKYKKLYDENRAILVYEPKSRGDMIAARDGEEFVISYLGEDAPMLKDEATTEDSIAGGSNGSLNRAEIEAIEEIEKLLSKDNVEAIIHKLTGTVVARYNLQSLNYVKTEKKEGEKTYHAIATLKGNGNTYGEVVLDAETGELLSLYSYDGSLSSVKKKTAEDEMRKTAERFAKTHASEQYEKSALSESSAQGRFIFTERVNGIEYPENRISVYVNEKNGKVMTYSKNWEEGIEFDSAENLISERDAYDAFIGADGLEKYYIADGINGYGTRKAEEFRLIYTLADDIAAYVDAKTGNPLSWDLKQSENEEKYKLQSDLKGHFAEKAVEKLMNNGVILSKKEKFSPNEAISRREMVYMLFMFERGYYIEPTDEVMDDLMREAQMREIVSASKTPATSVAYREEAASVIANLLGYKKAASIFGIYKTGFFDESAITKEYLGAVAIAKGLGIINGSNGKFAPRRAVTRGEFAVMLANAYGK